jgi:citrate lyase subunit beta/citryl-CoA lyase
VIGLVAPLFVPGDRPERFAKAAASGTDMIIIDLEDAVAAGAKDAARTAAVDYLASGAIAAVRINAPSTAWFETDLEALARATPAAVMVPKFEDPRHADRVRAVVGRDVPIIALVESAAAFRDLPGLLAGSAVAQVAVGTMDLAAELGCTPGSATIDHARSAAVFASRIAAVAAPLDGVTTSLNEAAIAEQAAREARIMGFGGKLCIHPRQVKPVLAAFRPSEAEIAWARKILALESDGVGNVDGEMIDAPVIRRARTTLIRANAG